VRKRRRPLLVLKRACKCIDYGDHLGNIHAAQFLQTFVEYPPSQPAASFSIDQIAKDVEERIKTNAAKTPGR
jgi:hypothetical protein